MIPLSIVRSYQGTSICTTYRIDLPHTPHTNSQCTGTAIRDVKGLVIGRDNFRFKAELNWNGAEIARQHLASFDLDSEFKSIDSPEKLRELMIRFGAGVIDRNGEEVDRVERAIKSKRPEIKHVDLESD